VANTFLDRATNVFGPLKPDIRARITRFLDDPSEENWDRVYSIAIQPFKTVWQAVLAVDPSFQRTKSRDFWDRVPDAMLVARAIRHAVDSGRPPAINR